MLPGRPPASSHVHNTLLCAANSASAAETSAVPKRGPSAAKLDCRNSYSSSPRRHYGPVHRRRRADVVTLLLIPLETHDRHPRRYGRQPAEGGDISGCLLAVAAAKLGYELANKAPSYFDMMETHPLPRRPTSSAATSRRR